MKNNRTSLLVISLLALVCVCVLVIAWQLEWFGGAVATGAPEIAPENAQPEKTPVAGESRPLEPDEAHVDAPERPGKANDAPDEDADQPWPDARTIETAHPNPTPVDPDSERSFGGLDWLSAHQNEDGHWSAAGFSSNSGRKGAVATHGSKREGFGDPNTDAGVKEADLAVTSLAMLTFLGAGYDHKDGDYRESLRKAILWLRRHLDDNGWTGSRGVRDHALATVALCESYGLSGDAIVKLIAEKAVEQLLKLQHSYSGWGENSWGTADIVSTCYAVTAIKAAKMSGLEVEWEGTGLHAFLGNLCNGEHEIAYSESRQNPPDQQAQGFERGPVCAAAWVVCALYSNYCELTDPRVQACADLLIRDEHLPKWERGQVDMERWWFSTQAIFQTGGSYMPSGNKRWDRWEKALTDALVHNQRGQSEFDKERGYTKPGQLDEHGSWDAIDVWSKDGRVSTTALAGLCLETYYRYGRVSDD